MQIFLTSHTQSSSHTSFRKKGRSDTQGFTLIELLICCAIIGIITAIVLLKYGSFDSTTLLKGAAYEIALNLREAQVKSVSVVRNNDNNNFDNPYGISFTPGQGTPNSKQYQAFSYKDETVAPPDRLNPKYGDAKSANVGLPTTLDRGMYVKDVCVVDANATRCIAEGITRLDISFRRPEFNSLFYAEGYSSGTTDKNRNDDMKKIERARITISSTNNPDSGFVIEVTKLGQISISPL